MTAIYLSIYKGFIFGRRGSKGTQGDKEMSNNHVPKPQQDSTLEGRKGVQLQPQLSSLVIGKVSPKCEVVT